MHTRVVFPKCTFGNFIRAINSTLHTLHRYELAWKMSRDSNDLLWWAIIGHTGLYLHKKIEDDRYLTEVLDSTKCPPLQGRWPR